MFSNKQRTTWTPPTGPITLTKTQFCNIMKTRPSGGEYRRLVGSQYGQIALENAFTENLRSMNSQNFWDYTCRTGTGHANLRFRDDASLKIFFETVMDAFFTMDIKKIKDRANYLSQLKGRAISGALFRNLQINIEPETSYYVSKPHIPKANSPAIPQKPFNLQNLSKALAWATKGLRGDNTGFVQTVMRYKNFNGTFPLGNSITTLDKAFLTLVTGAPEYRGWNDTASQQKYPSNIGGKKVLNDVIADLARTPMPTRGATRWYDIALYMLGAIITSQAFTDGNKRMSRFAYSLILVSGGVDFIAPTDRFGSQLGQMM